MHPSVIGALRQPLIPAFLKTRRVNCLSTDFVGRCGRCVAKNCLHGPSYVLMTLHKMLRGNAALPVELYRRALKVGLISEVVSETSLISELPRWMCIQRCAG